MVTTVSKSDLKKPAFLAKGGFGEVYRVPGYHLPSDPVDLAYKEFTLKVDEQAKSAEAAVEFRDRLDAADRGELDLYSTWPRALVKDGQQVCGLLMPLIPDEFFCRVGGSGSSGSKKPRNLSWLITTEDQRKAAQVDLGAIELPERLLVLALLVYVIGRLHKLGWVFGDISFNNAVFALNPPRMMLLDCDGAADLADQGRQQYSTPYWDPPESPISQSGGPPGQLDDRSDTYKLALAILRCLTPGKGAGTVRAPARFAGELDPAGVALVTRALSSDPGQRPSAKDLYLYLHQAIMGVIKPPEVLKAVLASASVIRGQDARIEWEIKNAARVIVAHGNNSRETVRLADHPDRFAFRPASSGPVMIEVQGRYATSTVSLGDLTLYELPEFKVDLNFLPKPQVPSIDSFSLEHLVALLKGRPIIDIGTIEMPAMPSAPTFELVKTLLPDGFQPLSALSGPRIDEAIADASGVLKDMILASGTEYAAQLRRAKLGV